MIMAGVIGRAWGVKAYKGWIWCDKLSSISWVVVFHFQFWSSFGCGKTVPSFEVSCGIWRRSNELTRAV